MSKRGLRLHAAYALLAALALLLAACGGGADTAADAGGEQSPAAAQDDSPEDGEPADEQADSNVGDLRIAMVIKGLDNPFFVNMETGAVDTAEALGVELQVEAAPGFNDDIGQANKLEALAGQGFDCFVVDPIDATNLAQGVGRLAQDGIPVVNIDEPIDTEALEAAGGSVVAYIGTDNEAAGAAAGEALAALVDDGAQVGLVAGLAGNETSNARIRGFQEGAGGLEFVGPVSADWDTQKALDVANQMMSGNPDLAGFFAANDQMAQGIARAVEQSGRDIPVFGLDGIEDILTEIQDGKVTGSVSQYPYAMGQLGVEACVVAATGGDLPERIESPFAVIDESNVDDALSNYPKPPTGAFESPLTPLLP